MLRKVNFAVGEFYHLYNRGVDKRIIFNDNHDRERFLVLLYICNGDKPIDIWQHFQEGQSFLELYDQDWGEPLVDIGSYCLMPNHFHLLTKEIKDGGISLFMKKFSTAYVMYFNKRNKRTGSLFEGVFKSKHADSENYLKYLHAYINLNPVKLIEPNWKAEGISNIKRIQDFLNNYKYSSYVDFFDKDRQQKVILNRKSFPEYFQTVKEFNSFIEDWLHFKDFESKEGLSFLGV